MNTPDTRIRTRPLTLLLVCGALLTGCTGGYDDFANKATVTAVVGFLLGISLIYSSSKIVDIERVRIYLKKLSSASKKLSFLLAIISIALILYGVFQEEDELAFNHSYVGAILLFFSNRLYCSSENWRQDDWESAKLNSKMMTFSASIIGVILFLIYGEMFLRF